MSDILGKQAEIVETRKPWQSKTVWAAVAMALLAFFPEANAFVKDHTEVTMVFGPVVFFLLRLITKGKISIS